MLEDEENFDVNMIGEREQMMYNKNDIELPIYNKKFKLNYFQIEKGIFHTKKRYKITIEGV